jgi:hypothetical protein
MDWHKAVAHLQAIVAWGQKSIWYCPFRVVASQGWLGQVEIADTVSTERHG